MEFLTKAEREIILTIAGKGGKIEYKDLFSQLSFLSEDTIRKTIESLYNKNYLMILKENNSIILALDKKIITSLQYLNLEKAILGKQLDGFKSRLLNAKNIQDKEKQIEEIKNTTKDLLTIIGLGFSKLLDNMPELTIPEYLDVIKVINDEVLSKLVSAIEDDILKTLISGILKNEKNTIDNQQ